MYMPVAEIFQDNRGSCEQPEAPGVTNYLHVQDNKWVVDQLNAGKKLGLMASADHTGVAQAFVVVSKLTREGLYEAFTKRNCFGSTAISIIMDFRCNNHPMGSEIITENANFELKLMAPENLEEVQVLQNGKTYKTFAGKGKQADISWQTRKKQTSEYWYIRVIVENGEIAWSSPIWLT